MRQLEKRYLSVFFLVASCWGTVLAAAEPLSIDDQPHQIKNGGVFEKKFTATVNQSEYVLFFETDLMQLSPSRQWMVAINGSDLGQREAYKVQKGGEPRRWFYRIGLPVPAGTLKNGENLLTVTGQGKTIVVSNFELGSHPLKQSLQLGKVTVKIHSADNNQPIPARVTVVDARGQLVKLYGARTLTTAVRPGILYTLGTGDTFSLPAGDYTIYVTRGMEWGVAKQAITVISGKPQSHTLVISREVKTPGFVACDSHIHTLPGSGHGNATYEERMITIAGEGIEVAIATDHNHISDYNQPQHLTGTQDHFHAIAGDEVTTKNGHFTAFPLDSNKAVPGGIKGRNPLFLKANDWVKLIADMRKKGAQVVILNHPYWPSIKKGPYGVFAFNRQLGNSLSGPEFSFNGIEVAQPANKTPDPFYAVNDWLALLNRGAKITAVGASDTHTVTDPVGQARCYLESSTDEVAKIDNKDIYRAYVEGRASVAVGIFSKLSVSGKYSMGDIVPASKIAAANKNKAGAIEVQLQVSAPSWVHPQRAMIYVNGRRVAEQAIGAIEDQPTDKVLSITIDLPPYDANVVAFVLGDEIKLPGWAAVGKATQAITNPIFLDVDSDGEYSSPRETAQRLIGKLSDAQLTILMNSKKLKAEPAVKLHLKELLGKSPDNK